MAGKGGGAWKVAYADFVTAMMAFFMVMWLVGQSQKVKVAVAGYFQDPYGVRGIGSFKGAPSSMMPNLRPGAPVGTGKLVMLNVGPVKAGAPAEGEESERRNNKSGPSLYVLHDGNRANSGVVVLFQENSAELDVRGKERLKEMIPIIQGKPNKLEIRGHATRRPLPPGGRYRDAWELCYARCLATMAFLEEQGIHPDRFRLSQAGAYEPQSLKSEDEWQTHNSRVEVYVLSEFVEALTGTRKERAERFGGAASGVEEETLPPEDAEHESQPPVRLMPQPKARDKGRRPLKDKSSLLEKAAADESADSEPIEESAAESASENGLDQSPTESSPEPAHSTPSEARPKKPKKQQPSFDLELPSDETRSAAPPAVESGTSAAQETKTRKKPAKKPRATLDLELPSAE